MHLWQSIALAISIFNAIICLWLGMTVTLDGGSERGPRLAAVGMLMAGVFFLIHAAVISNDTQFIDDTLPFWWRVISIPSLLAPYMWYATMVWYTGVSGRSFTVHKFLLIGVGVFISILVPLLIAIYPLPPQARTLALKIVPAWIVAGLPFIVAGYLLTLIICFILPIHALLTGPGRRANLPLQAWDRVRRHLIRTSVLGLLAGLTALYGAVIVFSQVVNVRSVQMNTRFFQIDVAVLIFVAAALVAAGQAVGAYAAFTERPLPQWNQVDQWRSLVMIAAAFALIVGLSTFFEAKSIYTILFATTVAAIAYALLSWRYRVEHAAFMDRLRPFVGSLHLQDRLFDGGSSMSVAVADLVEAVSHDVLRAERACLILRDHVPGLPQTVSYQWGNTPIPDLDALRIPLEPQHNSGIRLHDNNDGAEWAIPLWDGRGLAGALLLGAPQSGAVYSEELMEVAAACCARLTDALAGERAARMLADVLRQRIAEVKVLGSQGRRTLHDDILPQIHAALIHLSAMPDPDQTVTDAVKALSNAHSQLSTLIRTLPPATPYRLEHVGLLQTLHDLATNDFGAAFDHVDWQIAPNLESRLQETPLFVGEVISYAVQETLRNIARHARGNSARRQIHVQVEIKWQYGLVIDIRDDGIGIKSNTESSSGTGTGLRLHRSLLAVLGGSLTVQANNGQGTHVRLFVPEELWSLPSVFSNETTNLHES